MADAARGATDTVLQARGVERLLGDKRPQRILRAIDLTVRRGEFVALTGSSGSGKSTLLYLLGALDRPSSGQVIIEGEDTGALDDDGRARLRNERLGFVFQFHFLLPEFSVVENVTIPMLRRGVAPAEARSRAMEVLDEIGLGELAERRPSELSGGQQQRVSIARALANRPSIVLADEPTGNLDTKNGQAVMQLFERLNRERRTTIVMVTHDADFAARATRCVLLRDGAIVSDRAVSKLR